MSMGGQSAVNAGLQDVVVGWQAVDPGDPPTSPYFDSPPVAGWNDLGAAHEQWKLGALQHQQSLAALHAQTPMWFPLTGAGRVLPIFGGNEMAIPAFVTNLVASARDAGATRIDVANFLAWRVLDDLRARVAKTPKFKSSFAVVAADSTTVDPFGKGLSTLCESVGDILRVQSDRQGARAVRHDKQRLLEVGKLIDQPVTIAVLRDAIDVIRGGLPNNMDTSFSISEIQSLRDYAVAIVAQGHGLTDQLTDLHADLSDLARFVPDVNARPTMVGRGPSVLVRASTLELTGSTNLNELALEVLSRAVARSYGRAPTGQDHLIVVGAERLADEIVDTLVDASSHFDKQLILIFTRISEKAVETMGHGGSSAMVFLKLSNSRDAKLASDQLGHDFTFVINGISLADGTTTQWNDTYGTNSSTSHTSGINRSRNHGGSGLIHLNWGRSIGSSVSDSFTNGSSKSQTTGGGTSSSTTVSTQRSKEAVLEPEAFQDMDNYSMFFVNGRTVTLASFDPSIRKGALTSPIPIGP